MALILIFFPLLMAGLALVIPSNTLRPWLLPITAIVHLTATITAILHPEWGSHSVWLVLDPVGMIILLYHWLS
jgi:uncharacterized membrane protein YdbT with pleckstrin-like domain